jgi:hypothetical protein
MTTDVPGKDKISVFTPEIAFSVRHLRLMLDWFHSFDIITVEKKYQDHKTRP